MLVDEIVPVRHNEESVTRLSRYMVKKYIQAKDQVRYYSPELVKRGRISEQLLNQFDNRQILRQNQLLSPRKDVAANHDKLILM